MLDCLVRLQYIADPNPGEHRSKQLCTLPITIQGLPLDSKITEEWHLLDCDGSFNCKCKHPITLKDDDVSRTLVGLSEWEKDVHRKFFNWMTFGNHVLWKQLPDDLLEQIEESQTDELPVSGLENGSIIDDDQCDEEYDEQINEQSDGKLPEADDDLVAILELIECEPKDCTIEQYFSDDEDEMSDFTDLEKSMEEMSVLDQDNPVDASLTIQERLKLFGFEKYKVPQLLCRHPPPATGRDDDIKKIREILDDVLVKAGYDADQSKHANRILSGPNNKIGKCFIQLTKLNKKYRAFLPEFPLLHSRKSKINILFSAYRDAGIVELLRFMRNDEHREWAQLLSIQHIDMATKHVRRIAMAFHLAFFIAFTQYIEKNDLQELLGDLENDDC